MAIGKIRNIGGGNVSKKAEVLFFAGTNSQKTSGTIDLPKSIEGKYVAWGFMIGDPKGYLVKDLIPNQVVSDTSARGSGPTYLYNTLTVTDYKQVTVTCSGSSFTIGTRIIVAGSDKTEVRNLIQKYVTFSKYGITDKTGE